MAYGTGIDTSPNIRGEAQVGSLSVKINGFNLRSQDIKNLQINYEDIIKAKIDFTDTMNLTEFAPLTFAVVQIMFQDAMKNQTDLYFIVTKVDTIRIKNNQVNISLTLEQVDSNSLSITYLSKTFIDKTFLEMLDEIFKELDLKISIFNNPDDKKHDFFVFPSNISLLEFIRKQMKLENIIMFSDRGGLSLVSRSQVDFINLGEPTEFVFTLDRNKETPYWNILEYYGEIANTKKSQQVVKSNIVNHDVMNIGYFPERITYEDVYKTQMVNGGSGYGSKIKMSDLFKNEGVKEISHINYNLTMGDLEDFRDMVNTQQKFNIVVEGLAMKRFYSKVTLQLPRAVGVQTKEGDAVFGGNFIITKIIDKIVGGNFLQYLTLQSSDYGDGAEDFE